MSSERGSSTAPPTPPPPLATYLVQTFAWWSKRGGMVGAGCQGGEMEVKRKGWEDRGGVGGAL